VIDMIEIGAGGGSIAHVDEIGLLKIGPQSAGADPGPACYGYGGTDPTVTDANLLLGHLAGDSRLAGGIALDAGAAARAIDTLARSLGLDRLQTAAGVVRVANQEMVRALRVVTVERGVDPRGFALLPFGGAGPMHAAAIAAELGIESILCPRAGGVLSALGLCASERRRDTARTVMLSGTDLSSERIAAEVDAMITATGADLEEATAELTYGMRYAGQAFELAVPGPAAPDPDGLGEDFERRHEERYGHRDPDGEIVLVDIRLAMLVPGPEPRPAAATDDRLERAERQVWFGGEWLSTPVLRGEPASGTRAEGPVVFELPEATLVLPPGWSAAVDDAGTVIARFLSDEMRNKGTTR
jgi:N-methylhydantoinase A